jgi:N-acetylglucosaminyl-diphospho-decaprenol L-rhamnosyltransferase
LHDLAIIIVSTNEADWLAPCLTSVFDHAGALSLDVVVADNESTDRTRDVVEREFPQARVVRCRNRGFAHGNNRALMTCDARYVLFLNPDTEVLEGSLEDLIATLDERPRVGLVGVRQLWGDGTVYPTIRRFPSALRDLCEALGAERLPGRRGLLGALGWLGERELRPEPYERETACDWTVGSFMLVRREAIDGAGFLDERFFMYSDEPDLCWRIKQAGWDVLHLPQMTIVHHAGKSGVSSKVEAQMAFAKLLFARKHFSRPHLVAYRSALLVRHGLRALVGGVDRDEAKDKRAASRSALRVLLGREEPPYGQPPPTAVAPRVGR